MPMQITHTGNRLPIGADMNPVRGGYLPAGAGQGIPGDLIRAMPNGARLRASGQKELVLSSRRIPTSIPFSRPLNRRMIPGARGPVRPLEWGTEPWNVTAARGRVVPVPVPIGGRRVEFRR